MISVRQLVYPALLVVAACSEAPEEPSFRSYDLTLSHPSPYASYLSVSPGSRGAGLPRMRQIKSRNFSEYLRSSTGCVVDMSRSTMAMGHKRMPAGYMVPVVCP